MELGSVFLASEGLYETLEKNSSCVLAIGPGKYTREINY